MSVSASATYRIKHQTLYKYSEPVAVCQNQLRMFPRSRTSGFIRVDCRQLKTHIEPAPLVQRQHQDYYGNVVNSFSIETNHRALDITIESEVTIDHADWPDKEQLPAWGNLVETIRSGADERWHEVQEFCFDSPRVRRGQNYADYAKESFGEGRRVDEAVLDLTRRINRDFKYNTSVTNVETETDKAFELRAGVCQDFAHVQLACLRSIGLPAKYVSGYLKTEPAAGEPRLVGADESHAWVSVYMGSQLGWVDVDPTNACICDTSHIPVAVGRDYSEVTPMRGVVLGGGETQLQVSVDVRLID